MTTVIEVENLSKQYRLGNVGLGTIGADLNRWYQTSIRRKEDPYLKIGDENDRSVKGESDYVWALRNINFEVQQGEVLGIIGRNGAGKSTLLKILSRTTTPTTGQIKIKGRVASLLEVGTGFHPELSGRENIFLNGAILGMTKKEIISKFDEIVDFAGVERYIDTPVKRYSSGMYVRLAFGVAAHLEPEILIVDEVLAVGDIEFQKKAIGKMKDVSGKDGRTVLFVSHNMAAVKSLCSKAILLENGNITAAGTADNIVAQYSVGDANLLNLKKLNVGSKDNLFFLKEVAVKARNKNFSDVINENDFIEIIIKYENHFNDETALCLTVAIKGEEGEYILSASTEDDKCRVKRGIHYVKMNIPPFYFHHGRTFYIEVIVVSNSKEPIIRESDGVCFFVNPEQKLLGSWYGKSRAPIRGLFKWEEID